jgi:gas vesicle protein
MSKQGRVSAFVGGMILGSAAGTILGLLIAPRTGRETRKVLKKSADALPELAEDLSTSFQLQADRLSESAIRNWDQTLTRLRDAIAAGIEASQLESKQLKKSSPLTEEDLNSSIAENHK